MRHAGEPRQMTLFDPADSMFSPMTLKWLRGNWPGVFRTQLLHLMPARGLGEHFHPTLGCRRPCRPTPTTAATRTSPWPPSEGWTCKAQCPGRRSTTRMH